VSSSEPIYYISMPDEQGEAECVYCGRRIQVNKPALYGTDEEEGRKRAEEIFSKTGMQLIKEGAKPVCVFCALKLLSAEAPR